MTRRDFTRLVLAAAFVLGVEAEAEAAETKEIGPPGAPPRPAAGFDAADLKILQALLLAFYGPGGDQTDALAALAEGLAYLAPDRQELIVQLPAVFAIGSRVLSPTVTAFQALPTAEQEAVLDDWALSDLGFRRQVFGALRQLLLYHAHTDPKTWALLDYPGPWVGRLDLQPHPLRFGEPT